MQIWKIAIVFSSPILFIESRMMRGDTTEVVERMIDL